MTKKKLTLLTLLAVQNILPVCVDALPHAAASNATISFDTTAFSDGGTPMTQRNDLASASQPYSYPSPHASPMCPKLRAARWHTHTLTVTLSSRRLHARQRSKLSSWPVFETSADSIDLPYFTEAPTSPFAGPPGPGPPANPSLPNAPSQPASTISAQPVDSTIPPTPFPSMGPSFPSITTVRTTLTTSEIQIISQTVTVVGTTGTVHSTLTSSGAETSQPFNTTIIPTPTAPAAPITSGTNVISATMQPQPSGQTSAVNVFRPIGNSAPPPQISQRSDHPVPRTDIVSEGVLQTNKFYANFFLGSQTCGTWTHPYSVAWVKGSGLTQSWGISISHIERKQLVYGPPNNITGSSSYFINPIGIQSVIISAVELGSSTSLSLDSLKGFSVNVALSPQDNSTAVITFPLVQGMGFVTAIYNQGIPLLQSSVFFNNLTYDGTVAHSTTIRYQANLNDGSVWLIYLTPNGTTRTPALTLVNNSRIQASYKFNGILQIAKNNAQSTGLAIYDASAGVYPMQGQLSGVASGASGTYSFSWLKGGIASRNLLMFALPHHLQTFSMAQMNGKIMSAVSLETTTKGIATAIVSDSWTMSHDNLPWDMDFAPWSPSLRSRFSLPSHAVTDIVNRVAASELNENYEAQTNLNSMYFAGKALAKLASLVYATAALSGNKGLGSTGLLTLKQQFSRFVNNTQIFPLVYDSCWGGAVSTASYATGDAGADFGNTYYNDHHFHYGYFVYSAAVIAYLDPAWLNQGTNKAWVNMLVRDYANPSTGDGYFPFSRMFDWYHGHSWAHGLYETADGKDQESSSEDVFATYALKMWGKVTGDASMEGRGNLMLAIQAASLNSYYLYNSNNTVEPSNFIGNKVAGILFENKIDHTTYFGTNPEYIQGIHMLPLSPASALIRTPAFVQQEWNAYFSNGRADQEAGGWRGILYANLALVDPKTAWAFFSQPNFDNAWLDGGASRTWYLALCAGWGAFT